METKKYQRQVLSDLRDYTEKVRESKNPSAAFKAYWKERPQPTNEDDSYLEYKDTIPGVPRVTAKVPTAGGKTYIACNALREIIDNYIPSMEPKVIVWFVPSESILTQTYRNLSNPAHPYRHIINTHFNGSVQVYDKESLLAGQSFKPENLGSQLSILVLEIQSFASKTKDLRAYKDNENLYPFVSTMKDGINIPSADESSLIRVIANLHPIVIVDESHNFQGDLRIETLKQINPKFIYELTATPRISSNVISFITARDLKSENMVKLPVYVCNRINTDDVLYAAYNLRNHLEEVAKGEDDYIRPIILFQAEPKNAKDNVTFDKLRDKLIGMGIDKDEIAIKVSGRDELKGKDLMSRDCKIRYIITVNALKEGWDCPFAYILASIADKNSRIDVEQLLGRTLRLPYARPRKSAELSMAYVLTSSNKFMDTMQQILAALNSSGFNENDVRQKDCSESFDADDAYPDISVFDSSDKEAESTPEKAAAIPALTTIEKIDTSTIRERMEDVLENRKTVQDIIGDALRQNSEYNASIEKESNKVVTTQNSNRVKMRSVYKEAAEKMKLPVFYVRTGTTNVFNTETNVKLKFPYLLKGLNLDLCDKNITFAERSYETMKIDINDQGKAVLEEVEKEQMARINEHFKGLSSEGKVRTLTDMLAKNFKKYNSIDDISLRGYIRSILETKTESQLIVMEQDLGNTIKTFQNKLNEICTKYAKKKFIEMKDSNKIFIDYTYAFPSHISVNASIEGLDNELYLKEENNLNELEMKVAVRISQLDNVLFWHRNDVRGEGFGIHAFMENGHYPDFIVVFRSGVTAMIETKGEHLTNFDSINKLELGNYWSNMSDGSKFKYFMVYEGSGIDGAKSVNEVIDILKTL